jgi:hypothetical protein
MWRCEKCGSNLLESTPACPVCKLPPAAREVLERPTPSQPEANFAWIWAVGIFFPPLGAMLAFVWLIHWLSPRDETKR